MVILQRALLCIAGCTASSPPAPQPAGPERPNILWLTFEDTSPYLFSAYGSTQSQTPNIDTLAELGVVFTHATAVAPQCSPARASLISGTFATTYGTDWHRQPWPVPAEQYFFPPLLRQAGYFTTNNKKTDYNATGSIDDVWVRLGKQATYSDEARGERPFFSVFDAKFTHMSRVRTHSIEGRYAPSGPSPEEVEVPPFVPDLPETRSDLARAIDGIEDLDRWVGLFLRDLEERGLADDTILFFFSDHGGTLPREKAFPFRTGHAVPLIVYVPPRWASLSELSMGSRSDELVGFEDFAATVLALAGVEAPEVMQGRSFLQPGVPAKDIQFAFRSNTGPHYAPNRTAFDGRFRYIRSYIPYKPLGLRQPFQWGVPTHFAWDRAWRAGTLSEVHAALFEPRPTEELYDLEAAPWELDNLAEDPAHAQTLLRLREAVAGHIRETGDLGFFPKTTREHGGLPLHDWVRETDYPLQALLDVAERASFGELDDLPVLVDALHAPNDPARRFWGAVGIGVMAQRGTLETVPPQLPPALQDDNIEVRAAAAGALCWLGETDAALAVLLADIRSGGRQSTSMLETLGELGRPLVPELLTMTDSQDVRSILINLGELPDTAYYTAEEIQRGIEANGQRMDWTRPDPAGSTD